jgi:RHS repeat-associated protein
MATTTGATGDGGDKYTGFDRFGRVVDQRWITGSGSSATDVDRYGYTYDEHGNRTGRSNALAAAFSETYGYEGLNQLQSFTRGDTESPSLTQGWQFDALGNWTTFTTNGTDQTRVFNAQNELLQVGSSSLTYSATGNMTTDAQGRTLVYDAWNRLVSVSNASGTQIAAYQYDGMNRRIAEQVAATGVSSAPVRDMFYSQSWQVLEERVRASGGDIPATADTRYIWSPVYVDALVARDRNADANTSTGTGGLEERVYALQDANWNTTAIVAASGVSGFSTGAIINRFVYTPYGESQTLTASWGTPAAGSSRATPWQHLFQGLKFSDVTGLAHVRHRDYSASLGRFIELDPIGFDAGDNNWYRFVGNGPTGNVDPSGLQLLVSGRSSLPTLLLINPTSYTQNDTTCPNNNCEPCHISPHDQARLDQFAAESQVWGRIQQGMMVYKTSGRSGLSGYFADGPRYAYREGIGWIDLQHVAAAAAISERYGAITGQVAGYGFEFAQLVQGLYKPSLWDSAYSYEDLVSNAIGDVVGASGTQPWPLENLLDKTVTRDRICDGLSK